MTLTEPQVRRYSRHVLVPDVGGTGQARLLAATVSLDFAADPAATTVAATYLAAAGIGALLLHNLPTRDALVARLGAQNPDVRFPDTPIPPTAGAWHLRYTPTAGAPHRQAEALVRGGAAACEVIWRIVRGEA
jgi:hypothetical protein